MNLPTECTKTITIRVPVAGSLTYHNLPCDQNEGHYGPCAYRDIALGVEIVKKHQPIITVDEQGCIRS